MYIFFSANIDIFLFSLFINFLVFLMYFRLGKNNLILAQILDFKVFLISLLLVSFNYYGTGQGVNFINGEIHWLFFFFFSYFLINSILYSLYRN